MKGRLWSSTDNTHKTDDELGNMLPTTTGLQDGGTRQRKRSEDTNTLTQRRTDVMDTVVG